MPKQFLLDHMQGAHFYVKETIFRVFLGSFSFIVIRTAKHLAHGISRKKRKCKGWEVCPLGQPQVDIQLLVELGLNRVKTSSKGKWGKSPQRINTMY